MRYIIVLAISTVLLLARNEYDDLTWGSGIAARSASIVYDDPLSQDESLNDFVPLFYYEDDHFYLHGLTYGIKLHSLEKWQFSALSRVRFLNIPKEYQNEVQGDTLDFGLRARYFSDDNHYIDLEVMENHDRSTHANLTYSANLRYGDIYAEPHATVRVKDSTFNSNHYGRNIEKISADADLSLGLDLKYHLWSNFYLLGSADLNWMGEKVRDSSIVNKEYEYTLMAGFGLLNDKNKKYIDTDGMKPYVRLAQGYATPTDLLDILFKGDRESDEYNNQSTSIFYGHPLSKTFFGKPIEIYLTPGVAFHHSSEVQESIQEYILAFKMYYTLPFDTVKMRVGLGEGVSYLNDIYYIEKYEMEKKGFKPSNWAFYLDASIDLNLGFLHEELEPLWIGTAIHHRCFGFEEVSLFNRIGGGSNYTTMYLQWDF